MSSWKVTGGVPLRGEVQVRGAKNLVPKAMVAALLSPETSTLGNVPDISDVAIVTELLRLHGAQVEREDGQLRITSHHLEHRNGEDLVHLAGTSRIPVLMCGPLLQRTGRAVIPLLGGCAIGERPVGFHLDALTSMGAKATETDSGIELSAPQGLHATSHTLPYPSVGATEQVLLAAVTADGTTTLKNAAFEPEIFDLVFALQKMGADVSIEPDRTFTIRGVESLSGYTHRALPDRLETASWACAALATGGNVAVKGASQAELLTFLNVYRRVGGSVEVQSDGIRFWHPGTPLKSIALETDVHPGFSTDYQQPLVVALTQATGISLVHETVYENRFGFTKTLQDMGAQIQLYQECLGQTDCRFKTLGHQHSAAILGRTPLHATDIVIPDLRGGFSHLVAALAADGTSRITNHEVINRGYENLPAKVTMLGGNLTSEG